MKKVLNWVWSLLEIIIIIYVIVLTLFLLCKNKYGYTELGDYSFVNVDLMGEKNIKNTKNGDLLIVKNSNDISNGNLIYYYAVYNDEYIVKSGVVTDIKKDDYSAVYTVEGKKSAVTVASARVLGKYSNTYAHLGKVLDILESRIGFLFLVLLPIMIVFIYQLYEFIVILRYDEVDENEKVVNKKRKIQKDKSKKDDNIEIL